MKIVQIVPGLAYGDGVTNCVLSMAMMLDELGYSNNIIAFNVDKRIDDNHLMEKNIYELNDLEENDIIIYHFSLGGVLNYIIENLPYKKILVYHNVTIPGFYRGIDYQAMQLCLWGIYDASNTVGNYLKGIVLSEFSKDNLIEMGWRAEDVSVLPLININDCEIGANNELVDKYNDNHVNILFTGRVAPHKKIEDIINVFCFYQKEFNAKSRLILVGGTAHKNYYHALQDYILRLKVNNVIFTQHVSNEDLEAYYAVSNVFLCMSEHEGFCIPLVEAMKRKIPIVAYSAAAVPDTLGEAGILVNTKNKRKIAGIIDRLISDSNFREQIVRSQDRRLNFLGLENYKSELKDLVEKVNQIEEYSYAFERKEIFVSFSENLKPDYIYSLEQLQQNFEKVIIYGIGKVGKFLLTECKEFESNILGKIIICDNAFREETYNNIDVLKHKECVVKYPEALYIITAQNTYIDIIADLIRDNIAKENIKFYNAFTQNII